jgi:small subunit ribosomal protein S18
LAISRDQGARPQGRPGGRFGGRGRFQQRRKVCAFCADKNIIIDYKDTSRLSRYISERGKIDPRRRSGTCARHQRKLSEAIKQARIIALLPFVPEHIRKAGTFWTMSPAVPKAPEAPAEVKAVATEAKPEAAAPAAPAAAEVAPKA